MMDAVDAPNLNPPAPDVKNRPKLEGGKRIVMQTVVHLDGDIITRIHPHCIGPDYDTLRRYHHQSTEQSIRMWQQFINAVGSFFERIIRDLLGRG